MITHTELSVQASHMAKNLSGWAADLLTLPEDHEVPVREWSVKSFLEDFRSRLDRIEQWHNEPAKSSTPPRASDAAGDGGV